MRTFDFTFTVPAPLSAVVELHHTTHILQRLTPPPILVQMHRVEPLAEGSVSDFTLWFGPLPVHWVAQHTHVDPQSGFVDTQISGPLRCWTHTHTFTEESPGFCCITEHIEYEHFSGIRGLFSRLLFTQVGLWLTFCYRRFATRRLLGKRA